MKDATRQRIYRAEQAVRRDLATGARNGNAPGDHLFKGADAAREVLDTIIIPACAPLDHEPSTPVVKDIEVKAKGRTSFYRYHDGRIRLIAGWGESLMVLTHEYTHGLMYHVSPDLYASDLPSHGGEFTRLFLDAVSLVYRSIYRPDVPEALVQAMERERAIVQPHAQVTAARKQVLRLRSDIEQAWGPGVAIPVTDVVYAEARGDFTGTSYKHTGHGRIDAGSTHSNDYFKVDRTTWGDAAIPWCNLRYVAAPMVRAR